MNKFLLMAVAAVCSLPTMAQKADSLVFTTVLENPVTSIKNQNNSGTCWSYSALAFLESEVLKKDPSKKDIDLEFSSRRTGECSPQRARKYI